MNAERLHAICNAIRADLDATESVSQLEQLATHLQNVVSQPNQGQHQQSVSQIRQDLAEKLDRAASNDFAAVWVQVTEEIGAAPLLGRRLRDTLEEIFSRNEITPSTAQQEVQELSQQVQRLSSAIDQLLSGFGSLLIGDEDLAPGECELAVLVPRDAVKNELPRLGEEFEELQKVFGPFAEISTGSRPPLPVRTISSSDFSVFLDLVPPAAACVAVAVERSVAFYKQLLEIRALRQKLSEQGVADASLQGVDAHANSHMETGIAQIVDELVDGYAVVEDEGRVNELRTELKLALNRIANRIDNGYNIDVRTKPPENAEDEEESEAAASEAAHYQTVLSASENLRFVNLSGEPILSLPESGDSEDES